MRISRGLTVGFPEVCRRGLAPRKNHRSGLGPPDESCSVCGDETAEATHHVLVRALLGVGGCPTAMQLPNDLFGRGLNSCPTMVCPLECLPTLSPPGHGPWGDQPSFARGMAKVTRRLRRCQRCQTSVPQAWQDFQFTDENGSWKSAIMQSG